MDISKVHSVFQVYFATTKCNKDKLLSFHTMLYLRNLVPRAFVLTSCFSEARSQHKGPGDEVGTCVKNEELMESFA
jgi:hypothetical protein